MTQPNPSSDPASAIAEVITAPEATQNLPYVQMRQGSVVSVNVTDNSCSIYLSGDTTTIIDGVKCINGYTPVVGDNIFLLKQGTDLLGLGLVGFDAGSSFGYVAGYLGSTSLLESSAFTTVVGSTSFQITKRYPHSAVRVFASITGFSFNQIGGQLQVAVNFNGVVYIVGEFTFDQTNVRGTAVGERFIAGLPAGTYNVVLQACNATGGGTSATQLRINAGDWGSFSASEIL